MQAIFLQHRQPTTLMVSSTSLCPNGSIPHLLQSLAQRGQADVMIACVFGSVSSRASAMATAVEADSPVAIQIIKRIYLCTFLSSVHVPGEAASRLLAVKYPRLLTPCGVCSDDPRQLILSTFHDEGAFDRLETRVCRSHGHTVGLTYAARNKATVSPAVMRIRQE